MKRLALVFLMVCSGLMARTRVLNYGIAGQNTTDLLRRMGPCMADSVGLVVMMVGTNDFINDRKFVSEETYRKNLDSLCRSIPNLVLMTIPPVRTDRGFYNRNHSRENYKTSIDSLVMKCNEIIRKVGVANNIDVIDVNLILSPEWLYDGVHLDQNGQLFMAAKIAEYLALKKIDPKVIACFGDSITAGTPAYPGYPHFLTMLLNWNEGK